MFTGVSNICDSGICVYTSCWPERSLSKTFKPYYTPLHALLSRSTDKYLETFVKRVKGWSFIFTF